MGAQELTLGAGGNCGFVSYCVMRIAYVVLRWQRVREKSFEFLVLSFELGRWGTNKREILNSP